MVADGHARWHRARVAQVAPAAEGIARIELDYPVAVSAPPGSHVDVRVPTPAGDLLRSYSVVRAQGPRLTLGVHRSPTSRGGSAGMHALAAGAELAATEPLQNFPLGVGARRYVLVAGGIGVTALVAMASVLRARGADYTVVYVGRSRAAMAYAEDLAAEHGERLRLHVDDEQRPLDVEALLDEIAADERVAGFELYLCGPIRLMDAIRRGWARRGLPAPSLRFETFGNSGAWAPQEFVVKIPRLGVQTTVGTDATLLDALQRAGVDMMWDCRKGECGLCQVRVLEVDGRVDHRDVFFSPAQKEAGGSLCACVSRVVSAGTPGAVPDRTPEGMAAGPGVLTIDVT